jgi:hypothetical protein
MIIRQRVVKIRDQQEVPWDTLYDTQRSDRRTFWSPDDPCI